MVPNIQYPRLSEARTIISNSQRSQRKRLETRRPVQQAVVQQIVAEMMQAPTTRKPIQLAFHDCLKNIDSNGNHFGGCNGCLNCEGVDFMNEVTLGNVELMVDRHWTRAAWRRQSTKRQGVQTGGPPQASQRSWGFSCYLPYKLSFVKDFTVYAENHPRGCNLPKVFPEISAGGGEEARRGSKEKDVDVSNQLREDIFQARWRGSDCSGHC